MQKMTVRFTEVLCVFSMLLLTAISTPTMAEPISQPQSDTLLVNGDLETPSKNVKMPMGWQKSSASKQHVCTYVDDVVHGGKRALKVSVAEDAKHTWVQWKQQNLAVTSGQKFTLNAFVKSENIKGVVGFYVHVYNAKRKMVVNQVIKVKDIKNTDWQQIKARFTVPEDGIKMTVGTVLKGTGTAWYDDFVLTEMK